MPVLLIFSCRAGKKAENYDRIQRVEADDPVLEAIAEEARKTLPRFIRTMRNPQKGEKQFRIKCPFEADRGSGFGREYLWLADIRFENGNYYGAVASRPYYIRRLAPGSRTAFSMDDIADWMYVKDGKIAGGLSIKYLIEKIPPLDRDAELNSLLEFFE
jgi:uncharacterized protein YegJ (DUF2314 family)